MGLDSYLIKKTYISRFWKENVKVNEEKLKEAVGEDIFNQIKYLGDLNEVDGVSATAAYWRKANAIHNWFVNNGYDENGGTMYVSHEKLQELYEICKKLKSELKLKKGFIHNGTIYKDGKSIEQYMDGEIIANPELAKELLPTTEGFFFGSTDYNTFYIYQIDETIEQLEKIFANPDWQKCDYYYEASW